MSMLDNTPLSNDTGTGKGKFMGIDNTANGHFRLLVALMLTFFFFGAAWTAGLDMGILSTRDVADTAFKVSWDLILIAIGVFRGIKD